MVNIRKAGDSSIVFDNGKKQVVLPIGAFQMVAIADSKTLSVRLTGSRNPIIQFAYDETNLEAGSASELIDAINSLKK